MPEHSSAEQEIRAVVADAAASISRNPWGPVYRMLATHADVDSDDARALSISDSTVIDRAIGSPGMIKPLKVHGFIVKDVAQPDSSKHPADLEDVVTKVSLAIRSAPYISTAVIFSYTVDYYPSHVLSCDEVIGRRLADLYPHAEAELAIAKDAADAAATSPQGPWRVVPTEILGAASGAVTVTVDESEKEVRHLAPFDAIVLTDPSDSGKAIAVGRLNHIRPDADGTYRLIFDRFSYLGGAAEDASTPASQSTGAGEAPS